MDKLTQNDLASLSGRQLLALVVRLARRILPILSENEQESRIETATRLSFGLDTVESFCQTGEIEGCGLAQYSGDSMPIIKADEAIRKAVQLKHRLFRLNNATPSHNDVDEMSSSAFDIIQLALSSVREIVSVDAENDLMQALITDFRALKQLEGNGNFLDPTNSGQLGGLWDGNAPEWFSSMSKEFVFLLEAHRKQVQQRIKDSTVRCGPEGLAEEYCKFFESIAYERRPNPCTFLRDMVVNAYDASLQNEEGRPVRFKIKFEATSEFVEIPFTAEYSTKNLVKLAPTIGLGFRHLIVCPRADHASLEIRGITDLELQKKWQDDVLRWSFVRKASRSVTEVDLRLRVLGAGHIQIVDSNHHWELRNGRSHYFQPIVGVKRLRKWFQQALPEESRSISASAVGEFALCKIIQKMVANAHGGTLLLGAKCDQRLTHKHNTDAAILRKAIVSYAEIEESLKQPEFNNNASMIEQAHFSRRALTRAIDTVAALTAVDGATIISDDLLIQGFGTEISYKPAPPNTEVKCMARAIGIGPGTIEVGSKKLDGFGMRHRSAFGYCSEDEDAIAIVVSQDGGISVFCTDDDKEVVLYQNVIPDRNAWGWMKQ